MHFLKIVKLIHRRLISPIYSRGKNSISKLFIVHIPLTLQRAKVIRSLKPAFISTMTKSGTWYNREFFYFYNQLLEGKKKSEIIDYMVKKRMKIPSLIKANNNKLGYDAFFISHWLCPGFSGYNGKYRKNWENLIFYSDYTYPSNFGPILGYLNSDQIKKRYDVIGNWCPGKNVNARLIFY
tara:strand:- start:38 stop:580 length:543 start_codon:yes stop_codon:yes gene_type:complete